MKIKFTACNLGERMIPGFEVGLLLVAFACAANQSGDLRLVFVVINVALEGLGSFEILGASGGFRESEHANFNVRQRCALTQNGPLLFRKRESPDCYCLLPFPYCLYAHQFALDFAGDPGFAGSG